MSGPSWVERFVLHIYIPSLYKMGFLVFSFCFLAMIMFAQQVLIEARVCNEDWVELQMEKWRQFQLVTQGAMDG